MKKQTQDGDKRESRGRGEMSKIKTDRAVVVEKQNDQWSALCSPWHTPNPSNPKKTPPSFNDAKGQRTRQNIF